MARKRYSWALAFTGSDDEVRALSPKAREGWEYARQLARNARERSAAALAGDFLPEKLTPAKLTGSWDSPIAVHAAIKQARIELFGKDLSPSAIAYRLQQRRERELRLCAEPGCETSLPRLAHGSARYCAEHGTGRARASRHRRTRVAGSG